VATRTSLLALRVQAATSEATRKAKKTKPHRDVSLSVFADLVVSSQINMHLAPRKEGKGGASWKHSVYGAISGATARTCVAPFERLKILLEVLISSLNCHSTVTYDLWGSYKGWTRLEGRVQVCSLSTP
jgi:hypothetical protein